MQLEGGTVMMISPPCADPNPTLKHSVPSIRPYVITWPGPHRDSHLWWPWSAAGSPQCPAAAADPCCDVSLCCQGHPHPRETVHLVQYDPTSCGTGRPYLQCGSYCGGRDGRRRITRKRGFLLQLSALRKTRKVSHKKTYRAQNWVKCCLSWSCLLVLVWVTKEKRQKCSCPSICLSEESKKTLQN